VIAHLWEDFILSSFKIHLGMRLLDSLGTSLEPLVMGTLTLLAYWLVLYWMFKKKIFIRI
jgi:heparan-alpha-glucosaminide N-acetyltransferase